MSLTLVILDKYHFKNEYCLRTFTLGVEECAASSDVVQRHFVSANSWPSLHFFIHSLKPQGVINWQSNNVLQAHQKRSILTAFVLSTVAGC